MTDWVHGDRALVRRMLRGDEEAFAEFFNDNFPRLYRFALTRLGNDADTAEEVVQVTLTKVVAKLHTYRGEAALFSWICTFCRRELSSHYKRHRGGERRVDLIEDGPEIRAALESLAAVEEGPEEKIRRAEVARLVQATLDHLPARYGDVLEWKYIHGLSVREIAGRLGVGNKAAESLLTRARRAFRDAFSSVAGGLAPWQLGLAGREER